MLLPESCRALIMGLRRRFFRFFGTYQASDSETYWRARASCPGQQSVLWLNEEYNMLYRERQREILRPFVENLDSGAHLLDLGCGIGIVTRMLRDLNPEVWIDAVDFQEMVAIAEKNSLPKVRFIASPAQNYESDVLYELILSSGCLAAIKEPSRFLSALSRCAALCKKGGTVLMVDPFHSWRYLARAPFSSTDVILLMSDYGFRLSYKSGVLFWPYRDLLANSSLTGDRLRSHFDTGERLLGVLGRHLWADYKILAFIKS